MNITVDNRVVENAVQVSSLTSSRGDAHGPEQQACLEGGVDASTINFEIFPTILRYSNSVNVCSGSDPLFSKLSLALYPTAAPKVPLRIVGRPSY